MAKTYDRIQAAFPDESLPAVVVVKAADVTSAEARDAIGALKAGAAGRDDLFEAPASVGVSQDRTVAEVSIPTAGDGTDATSNAALDDLRGSLVPKTVGRLAGAEAVVGGVTASTRDFNDGLNANVAYVCAFVLSAASCCCSSFRSIVIPLKATLLNLLSVGAAYGLLVLPEVSSEPSVEPARG